ncbi:uncharacterized protein LOC100570373 [Acyrthosiphon pisum]|uniref:Uncharacterized protein n=1 Tax=Acyrthosiphon pisum TaxID=7029 RepID=J9LY60_ACYPI|nr:uncharacterized protein LOC100570373 [Acyrthosiphon pisum]XP_008187513.2 uncharacterized protein LOC100569819 [Acyrthosiphon pisum]XP_016663523.1 uncharacterized protein LOC100569819 [Acyrthosiphon pisum]XP_016663526.1 uncharacterized protein LOC100570373 [Acyrthosiphon pisum]XP_029342803.1 uncharacterized protein LOC100569819 [Acyrthosiphon pisum]XP_029342804.1 uncharacterized protein LOC100570373 [Acyrthosiphon pisum]|eukprot:XP_003247562.1 PREDICTED: uncharacterized protein LOC100570373 [Acyrthosiphon pisum]
MFSRKNIFTELFFKSLSLANTNHYFKTLNQVKNHSTFHKWTLDYFRNQPPYNKFVLKESITEDKKSLYSPINLNATATDELLMNYFSLKNVSHHEIDKELANRVDDMSINQILALMDACLSGKTQFHKTSRSFKKCIELMNELWFRRPDLTTSQTIQLIYYVSIYKNKTKQVVEFGLQKLMNEIDHLKKLTDEELSVIAVATYKTSAKVYDKMLRIFAYRVERNLDNLIQNPLNFVSIIKPLKRAKYHDPVLLTQLIKAFSSNKNNKVLEDVTSSIHLLTYFADANCGEVDFLQQLIDSIGNIMIKDCLKHYRIKDVSNYVFSASYLGLTPKNPNVCKMIINFLENIFNSKEKCEKMSKTLIGMCLSMWMLNYKPIQLMQFMFFEVPVAALRMPNAHKQDNRLNLLLTCAHIEQPDLIMGYKLIDEQTTNSMPDPYKHLAERPFLVMVYQSLQKLYHELDIMNVEYNFSIPYLRILGIKIIRTNGETIYVEVLDSSNCLYDTLIPNGMMKLKFRLESKLNFFVIKVNHNENTLQNPVALKRHLESLLSDK